MLKSLLLSCAAALLVCSASAQQRIKPLGLKKFNTEKAVVAKQSLVGMEKKPMAKGWFQNSQMKRELSRANGVAKTPSVTQNWFEYPNAGGSCYTLSFSSLAKGLSISDTEFSTNTQNNIAIVVPPTYAGAVIDQVCNIFYQTTNLTNAKVWVNDGLDSLPSSAEKATYSQDIPSADIKGLSSDGYLQYSYVTLDNPVTVGSEGCTIGFSFTCPASAANIITTAGTGETGGFYIWYPYNGQSGWDDFSQLGVGNLSIAAHMDLSNVEINSLTCNDVLESTVLLSDEVKEVPVSVNNDGIEAITSYSYVMSVDGEEQAEVTVDTTLAVGSSYIYLPVNISDAGEHAVSVKFTKVNGKDNGSETASEPQLGYLLVLDKSADRTSVVEEATSTGCGYCPRGTVGMDKVKSELGDKVVVLSAHVDYQEGIADPMTCDAYSLFINYYVSGYPTALVDRSLDIDPYAGLGSNAVYSTTNPKEVEMYKYGVTDAVNLVKSAVPSEGTVSLTATWDSSSKKVDVASSVNINIDREANPYSVVYVLSQDGMTGKDVTDSEGNYTTLWSQLNYYSQEFIDAYLKYYGQDVSTAFTDTDMDKYKNGAYIYEGEVYNNVVVDAWGLTSGRSDYTPIFGFMYDEQQIIAGEALTHSTSFDLSSNTVITDWNKLKMAVLLVNTNNWQIVNAAQVSLCDDPAGIRNASISNVNATETARYTANGVRLNGATKGLNIVKFSDGTVKKVMVK